MKYVWIQEHRDSFPVAMMCKVLKVSTSGYYASLERRPSPRAVRHERIKQSVARAYTESHGIYGSLKIAEVLQTSEEMESACRNTVAAAMRELGIKDSFKNKLCYFAETGIWRRFFSWRRITMPNGSVYRCGCPNLHQGKRASGQVVTPPTQPAAEPHERAGASMVGGVGVPTPGPRRHSFHGDRDGHGPRNHSAWACGVEGGPGGSAPPIAFEFREAGRPPVEKKIRPSKAT